MRLIFFIFLLVFSGSVYAEDFPGGEAASDAEFAKGFSQEQGMQESDKKRVEEDRLKLGGSLKSEVQVYSFEKPTTDLMSTPATLDLYLDGQLRQDVRAFFKGHLVHDGTIDENKVSVLTGAKQKQSVSVLDELKVSFQTKHKIFWTIGRQKIKWGAGQFWNPTDFLNQTDRDFLKQEDLRSGLSMVKAHIPVGNANYYLIAVTEEAAQTQKTGWAARAEIPFSAAEWSVSSYSKLNQPTLIGSDLSFSWRDFDFFLEGSATDSSKQQQVSSGATYSLKYSDEDFLSIGCEYFWQQDGVRDRSLYSGMILANQWRPFHVGNRYHAVNLTFLKPGSWNDSNFAFYLIENENDRSSYNRLAWNYVGLTDMTTSLALSSRSGSSGSEMKISDQTWDIWGQLKVSF